MDDFSDFILITDESHDLYPFCPNDKKIEESEVNKQLNKHDADNSARFVSLSHTELRQFKIENQSAKATKLKTECNVRLFTNFLRTKRVYQPIDEISPSELNDLIGEFIVTVRKNKPGHDGSTEYEPSYLKGIMNSIDRYLRDKNYPHSLLRDREFSHARSMLTAKQRDLKRQGKGNKPHRSQSLSPLEIAKMWDSGAFGLKDPVSLQHTLWWYLVTEAGMRAVTEHSHLCWGDVLLKETSDGKKYLEHNERQTKMRMDDGAAAKDTPSKIFENGTDPTRCPVRAYMKFADKRPSDFCKPAESFFLQPIILRSDTQYVSLNTWYKKQPLGKHSIAKFMKKMAETANLSSHKKITNTSARKYCINQMKRAHVPPTDIAQKSGHKNIQSINNYGLIDECDQEAMGLVLRDTAHTKPVPYNQAAAALNENEVGLSSQITACNAPPPVATSNATVDYKTPSQTNNVVTSFKSNSCSGRLTEILTNAHIVGGDFKITINNYSAKEQ